MLVGRGEMSTSVIYLFKLWGGIVAGQPQISARAQGLDAGARKVLVATASLERELVVRVNLLWCLGDADGNSSGKGVLEMERDSEECTMELGHAQGGWEKGRRNIGVPDV